MSSRRLRTYQDATQALQRLLDITVIVVMHGAACWAHGQAWNRETANMTVVACISYSLIAESLGVYRLRAEDGIFAVLRPVLEAWAIAASTIALFLFATKTSTLVSRIVSFGWILITPFALLASRAIRRALQRARWTRGRGLRAAAQSKVKPSGGATTRAVAISK
jgi:hypothetical protein